MASSECRAKDPSVCRHHGRAGASEAGMNQAAKNGDFSSYEQHRGEVEATESASKKTLRSFFGRKVEVNYQAGNYAAKSLHDKDAWSVMSINEQQSAIYAEISYLEAAAPHMRGGVVTTQAAEKYAETKWTDHGKVWSEASPKERDISLANATKILRGAVPHMY